MKKRWIIKEQPDKKLIDNMVGQTGETPVLASLLIQRGIDTPQKRDDFFNPELLKLHDPFLMKDMDKAVVRIEKAVKSGERILVYGDYDVDGTTAVALVYMILSKHVDSQACLGFYIPDRFNEGYGISAQGIEYARNGGYGLVIALDCGIKAVECMKAAREMGIDFIICDHHVAGDEIPDVVACLDPKRPDCSYPDKHLSGCGVGFKLMQAYYLHEGYPLEELIGWLDLVVISIASDIVPMIGENRILAYHGLRQLNSRPHVGIQALLDMANVEPGTVTVADIVFKIGPRINAAGRMGSGGDAVRLLLSKDRVAADAIGARINNSNDERKDLDRDITRDATSRITASQELRSASSTVIYEPTWSKGVIGIVASRLTEKYYRPTVILTQSQANPAFATGSARSIEGFDVYRAIDSCSDLLENFGGHTYAAGLTMKIENVQLFTERFESYAKSHITPESIAPQIEIDTEIGLDQVTEDFLNKLDAFEPYGPLNSKPIFVTRGVCDYGAAKTFGRGHQHLKLDLISKEGRKVVPAVGFGLGFLYKEISQGQEFDVCYTIERNNFKGKSFIQLNIKDIKLGQ